MSLCVNTEHLSFRSTPVNLKGGKKNERKSKSLMVLIIIFVIIAAAGGIYIWSFQKKDMGIKTPKLEKLRANYSSTEA